jgi:hypothetical protein
VLVVDDEGDVRDATPRLLRGRDATPWPWPMPRARAPHLPIGPRPMR